MDKLYPGYFILTLQQPKQAGTEGQSAGTAGRMKRTGVGKTETYYGWQKRLFEIAKIQQEVQFAEVTPAQPDCSGNITVTVRMARVEADIPSGVGAATDDFSRFRCYYAFFMRP